MPQPKAEPLARQTIAVHPGNTELMLPGMATGAIFQESALELLGNDRQAELFDNWALYILIGYEQSTLPHDTEGLTWSIEQLLAALDSNRLSSAPPR